MEKQKKIECEFCGKKFTPKTSRARFCSDVCRVYANRAAKAEAATKKPEKKSKPVKEKVVKPKPKKEKPVAKKKVNLKLDKGKVKAVPSRRGKYTIREISLAEYGFPQEQEMVAAVDPYSNDNADSKVFVFPNDLDQVKPEKEMKTFNDFLSAAKNGTWNSHYEQLPAFLKLNANQRSMIQSKINHK